MSRAYGIGGRELEQVITWCLDAGRTKVLLAVFVLIGVTIVSDWLIGNSVSLAVLYIIPMMLSAIVLRPMEITAIALLCSFLRACFDVPASRAESVLRFVFALLAYLASGLFVNLLTKSHRLAVEHLRLLRSEQNRRREAEEQLGVMVESSPAAILTLNEKARILASNDAAARLFAIPQGMNLRGREISEYLPVLSDALRCNFGPEPFRTAAQCQGRRHNGEPFLAHTWFSSYVSENGPRLAAIVVDDSEEMRDREEQNLAELLKYNRIGAAAVSHEVRNAYAAIGLVSMNLGERLGLAEDPDYKGLLYLLAGLEKIASYRLHSQSHEAPEEILLKTVLDNLRIIIEPEWREIGGDVIWCAGERPIRIFADPHSLLQAFLNVAQNSFRAVQDTVAKELRICVTSRERNVLVRLMDSGPGVAASERLFEPFQAQADGSGLGLYISRAIVRSYGGDLRFEPVGEGSCFTFELQMTEQQP